MNDFPIQTQEVSRSRRLNARSAFRNLKVLAFAASLGFIAIHAAAADISVKSASSQTQAPITINLKQFKVVTDAHGDVQLADASAVLPGDVIEYRATYANRGSSPLPVVATLPIPTSLEYVKDSASADNNIAHTVALKDSQFSKEPLVLKIATASGATVSQPLPYASYRYVRWDLGNLSPGKSVEVSVRAKVAQNIAGDADTEDKASALASFLSIKK